MSGSNDFKYRMSNTVAPEKESHVSIAQSQPINATAFNRYLTLIAIKLARRFRKQPDIPILFLFKKLCVKCGTQVDLSEASTMQFVAKHTSIPVPRVHCAFTHKNRTYIVMERIHGEPVCDSWRIRSEESRARILAQLKNMVEEMCRITPPDGIGVANVDGGSLYDMKLPSSSGHFGPFRTIHDFHRYLRGGLEAQPNHYPEISELISQQDKYGSPPPVFTHGDLHSANILASGDKVVGIVDWETAGWYPAYWEYTTAWNVNPRNLIWREAVDKFLQPLPEELKMERIRLKYFGDVTD
ncbi:aminoglycoside phosphotransferase [Pyrenophora tritici-repentis]|uniref:Aminoglycoside phosphotransferase n=3 Tax=Pyrenophora tritici-repentis TaxID=45151 RepID=A0A2W1D7N8_9PLEO|nr:aminoglycoside phosphotransferase [Pyrenophora tritici-repentis]KAI0583308.1 Protein kinase-like domain [Pyrenophora tritici-repentis]KAI1527599.1 aminoglycoside phosphotransferase [Pyrenophora tritici-repentis]KAI1529097.1 aminoglycoside phosphotransferase [Pyrenophora tritici-repentis]KAI1536963.1 aminoglycoside phosphotransferase [Pyrenophora tritici-repentis]